MTPPSSVHVVGGGWAGLAAAVELARNNVHVTLLEASRQLGGRARRVPFDDIGVDNGQHLMIGAYRETLALLQALHAPNAPPVLRAPLSLTLLNANYGFRLAAPRLPAPLHLLAALLLATGLSFTQRLSALNFCVAMAVHKFSLEQDISVAELLKRYRQHGRLTECLWEPLCLATLNTPLELASAEVFLTVLRDAFTQARGDSDLVFSKTDLGALVPDPLVDFIETRGGHVLLGERVTALQFDGDTLSGLETSVQPHRASRVILATPAYATHRLVQEQPRLQQLAGALSSFDYQPICTVYLKYAPSVSLGQMLIGMTGGFTQWLFDRGHCGQPGIMAAVISAHGNHMNLDNETLVRHVTSEISSHFPHWPLPLRNFVVREKRATFTCKVGINATRPDEATAINGLWIAGDYTNTGYPATLEGAVRSGMRAARAVLMNLR